MGNERKSFDLAHTVYVDASENPVKPVSAISFRSEPWSQVGIREVLKSQLRSAIPAVICILNGPDELQEMIDPELVADTKNNRRLERSFLDHYSAKIKGSFGFALLREDYARDSNVHRGQNEERDYSAGN